MILAILETPKGAMKKLLELINEFRKVAGYKINIQEYEKLIYRNMLHWYTLMAN